MTYPSTSVAGKSAGLTFAIASAAAAVTPAAQAAIVYGDTPFAAVSGETLFADNYLRIISSFSSGKYSSTSLAINTNGSIYSGFDRDPISSGTLIDASFFSTNFMSIGAAYVSQEKSGKASAGTGSGIYAVNFESGAGTRYGWVDVSLNNTPSLQQRPDVTVNSWAYENTGASLLAGETGAASAVPEPDSLALFALGGLGLAAAKRRRRAAQARLAA